MNLGERIEQAIAAANGRGIALDIGKPIPEYRDYVPHVDPPRRRGVRPPDPAKNDRGDRGIPGVFSAEGRQTRSRRPLGWTHEQLAFAAAGMQQTCLHALLWCLGLDAAARGFLKYELLMIAVDLKETQRWPDNFRRADCEITGLMRCRHRYVEDLCTLALLQGAEPQKFSTEESRARWFGISEKHWRRSGIANGYHALFKELNGWYEDGLRYLASRLRAPPSNDAGSRQMSAG